jgi:hypothetical protein
MIQKGDFVKNPDFVESAPGRPEEINNHPVELLENIPQDLYISCISKITLLGFNGTYAGYLVSRMPKITLEGARMLISAISCGISLPDAATLAVIVGSDFKYRVAFQDLRFLDRFVGGGECWLEQDELLGGKREWLSDDDFKKKLAKKNPGKKKSAYSMFQYRRILEEVIPEKYLGLMNARSYIDFENIVKDDMIEGLVVMKYLARVMSKIRKSDITGFKIKYPHEKKMRRTPSALNIIEQKCYDVGIHMNKLRYLLIDRVSIINNCKKLGLTNIHEDVKFEEDIVNDIARLKRCIHSGLKNNLLTRTDSGDYYTSSGLKVSVMKCTSKQVLYNTIDMMQDQNGILFNAKAIGISSLDGWI